MPPSRHAAIDQLGVKGVAVAGAKAQALHHAWTVAFDQGIRLRDKGKGGGVILGRFQIQNDGFLAAIQQALARHAGDRGGLRAMDDGHLGTQIGQQHGTEGAGAKTFEFKDMKAFQHVSVPPMPVAKPM